MLEFVDVFYELLEGWYVWCFWVGILIWGCLFWLLLGFDVVGFCCWYDEFGVYGVCDGVDDFGKIVLGWLLFDSVGGLCFIDWCGFDCFELNDKNYLGGDNMFGWVICGELILNCNCMVFCLCVVLFGKYLFIEGYC